MKHSIAPHHQRGVQSAIAHYRADPHVLAIVLGGSLVRGTQRENSDVDAMVILEQPGYEQRRDRNATAEVLGHLCDYAGGYVDAKFFPRDYLVAAAERGSEPTRHSFLGAEVVYSREPDIEALLARITAYPEHERSEKIFSFYSSFWLASNFFWGEANKRGNTYLRTRTVADIVYFGGRLILAHNRVLFPNHKWMLEALDRADEKPAGLRERIEAFLAAPSDATREALVEPIKNFSDWAGGRDLSAIISRFVEDNEQWWWSPRPNLIEW